jgi:hypothetical protein
MNLFDFECKECANEIVKISKFKDMFTIKRGSLITCKSCGTQYQVVGLLSKVIFWLDTLLFGTGAFLVGWLFLTVLVDSIIPIRMGIWAWAVSLVLYFVVEWAITLLLPLKLIKK